MENNEVETPEINPQETVTKKDPKRVEQGKRLAAISKQAKEDKMRKKIIEENFSYFPFIVYGIAGISTFGFMYLLLFGKKEEVHPMTIIRETPPIPQNSPTPPKKKKFESFN